MQVVLQIIGYLVGLPLQLMVIAALLRGPYRRYPFLFLYIIADFLTTVLEIRPGLAYATASAAQKRGFVKIYWWDERIIQVMVFLLVISLVYRATAQWRPRRALLVGVVLGTAAFAAITFFVHFLPGPGNTGRWMTPWTRDLNFGAAILDLGLWAALIGSREKDLKLLMVSGALGIQFTVGAIGQALRDMSHAAALVALSGDLIMLANLACLYIWWQAFRGEPAAERLKPKS